MSAAARLPFAGRRQSLAAIHIARKDLALDDGTYRALLHRVTGKDSAGDLDDVEAGRVIAEFRRLGWSDKRRGKGSRRAAEPAYLRKIQALWWSAYHVGEIAHPDDQALAAFVKRQTGKDALAFLTPADANQVIEALRAVCARAGYRPPDTSRRSPTEARVQLLRAQWALLLKAKRVHAPGDAGMRAFLCAGIWPNERALGQYEAPLLDAGIRALGRLVRDARARAAT